MALHRVVLAFVIVSDYCDYLFAHPTYFYFHGSNYFVSHSLLHLPVCLVIVRGVVWKSAVHKETKVMTQCSLMTRKGEQTSKPQWRA